ARRARPRPAGGAGARLGRRRAAPPGARALRFPRPPADAAAADQPQRLRRRGGALRAGARRLISRSGGSPPFGGSVMANASEAIPGPLGRGTDGIAASLRSSQ